MECSFAFDQLPLILCLSVDKIGKILSGFALGMTPRKSVSLLPFLLLAWCGCTLAAADTRLELGKPASGTISAGGMELYTLHMNAGDLAEVGVSVHAANLLLNVFDPAGKRLRGFELDDPGRTVRILADDEGSYRLELKLASGSGTGSYAVTETKIVPLSDRTFPTVAAPKIESPKILALSASVGRGEPNAVTNFWKESEIAGVPLIEPAPGDDENKLVTFLWRGGVSTRNVLVWWHPFAEKWEGDYLMSRLEGTDVWFRTIRISKRKRFVYQLAPNAPSISLARHPLADPAPGLLGDAAQIDPLNPKTFLSTDSVDVREHSGLSILEMPDAPPQPWIAARKGVPAGHVAKTSFKSALLGNERDIYVYTPAGYSKNGKAAGLAVFFDAFGYFDEEATPTPLPAPTILDNLIAAKEIPPVVAVFIGNGPGDARDREFSCNPQLVEFLKSELLPWVHQQYNVASDPAETVVAGFSLGGLAAIYTAFEAPELFGNAISMSGALWWAPSRSGKPVDSDPVARPEWLAQQFIARPHLPIRLYLDAGSDEDGFGSEGILNSSLHMWDVLLAKGYDARYNEFDGGHDYLNWREGLADGLIFLLGAPTSVTPAK